MSDGSINDEPHPSPPSWENNSNAFREYDNSKVPVKCYQNKMYNLVQNTQVYIEIVSDLPQHSGVSCSDYKTNCASTNVTSDHPGGGSSNSRAPEDCVTSNLPPDDHGYSYLYSISANVHAPTGMRRQGEMEASGVLTAQTHLDRPTLWLPPDTQLLSNRSYREIQWAQSLLLLINSLSSDFTLDTTLVSDLASIVNCA